ncbi:immunoglobulin lambda-1 light chain-like isoform X2 [Triplophysa dalaica]|uniref:immunoglobulin lambda-1 light chain-like isoform X2 n=1 Tax=Triplophysa dalaica TaxID=1582913 RepID=UPI0024E029FA|nr:immunoglobulin lambda-1 light chain-like isoform X2 [Triplophysa dalaica]
MLIIFIFIIALSCVSGVTVVTQNPPELPVNKGEKVTMSCNLGSVTESAARWYKQTPGGVPQHVLRFYHEWGSPYYGSGFSAPKFTSTHSSKSDYSLIINNVDVRDSAVYYCHTWDSSAKEHVFGQGTKLLVTDSGVSPPVVYILPSSTEDVSSSEVTLVCLINDMSVGFADVRWLVNGNPVTKGVFTGSAEPQSDEKFKLSSYLTIETSEWQKDKDITCEVTAAGSKTTKKIKKSDCSQ